MNFPTVIDSTMRNAFASCEQKFWYEFVEQLGPTKPSIHLHAGATFAKGLEVFRRSYYFHNKPLSESVTLARLAMLVAWGDFEPRFSWDTGGHPKCIDGLFEALDYYLMTFDPATDALRPWQKDGEIAVEFSAAIPIPGTRHPETGDPILYAGRFDQLALYNDTLFVADDKTASQLGNTFLEQWEMRSQLTGYCWLAQQFGYPVAGAIIRGISFLKNGFGAAQVITMREDWKIQQWLTQLQRDVARMIALYETKQPNLNLGESCTAYGGCPFMRLCNSSDPSIWKGEYVRREWNPLARH